MEHPALNESGQSSGQISEPEEVPKNCEPGASLQSMLVATGSIEEMVEQEIDSSFTDKQVVGSTASTISEIQDGIQECQVNSEDEAEDLPVAQSVSVRIIPFTLFQDYCLLSLICRHLSPLLTCEMKLTGKRTHLHRPTRNAGTAWTGDQRRNMFSF